MMNGTSYVVYRLFVCSTPIYDLRGWSASVCRAQIPKTVSGFQVFQRQKRLIVILRSQILHFLHFPILTSRSHLSLPSVLCLCYSLVHQMANGILPLSLGFSRTRHANKVCAFFAFLPLCCPCFPALSSDLFVRELLPIPAGG